MVPLRLCSFFRKNSHPLYTERSQFSRSCRRSLLFLLTFRVFRVQFLGQFSSQRTEGLAGRPFQMAELLVSLHDVAFERREIFRPAFQLRPDFWSPFLRVHDGKDFL